MQKIVWATVNPDGDIIAGSGASVTKTGAGTYQIDFTDSFDATPSIIGSQILWDHEDENTDDSVSFPFLTNAHATAITGDNTDIDKDRNFSFIAIGY